MKLSIVLLSLAFLSACAGPHPLSNGSSFQKPLPTKVAAPIYPKDAADAQIQGFVKLGFDIQPNGTVINVTVIKS
jgi:outer membrane biosynthesis protein TonB